MLGSVISRSCTDREQGSVRFCYLKAMTGSRGVLGSVISRPCTDGRQRSVRFCYLKAMTGNRGVLPNDRNLTGALNV